MLKSLLENPYQFEFFQAVRLLAVAKVQQMRERGETNDLRFAFPGEDKLGGEAVRLHVSPSLAFPTCEISGIQPPGPPFNPADPTNSQADKPAELTVTFMGLTGPQSALPSHYTSMIIERLSAKDRAMLEFFDLFNHRILSLFYRAAEKYRIAPAYEHARLIGSQREDLFTQAIYALVGISTPALRNRLAISDQTVLYYSGLLSHRPRSAAALEQMLAAYLAVPVFIEQFLGHWLPLDEAERSHFPAAAESDEGCHIQLGETLVIGDRVWDVQGAFRIRLGPLNFEQYVRFLPGSDTVREMRDLTRFFVGNEFQFDHVPVLKADQIPMCEIGGTDSRNACLGRTAWLRSGSQSPEAIEPDFQGAIFDTQLN